MGFRGCFRASPPEFRNYVAPVILIKRLSDATTVLAMSLWKSSLP